MHGTPTAQSSTRQWSKRLLGCHVSDVQLSLCDTAGIQPASNVDLLCPCMLLCLLITPAAGRNPPAWLCTQRPYHASGRSSQAPSTCVWAAHRWPCLRRDPPTQRPCPTIPVQPPQLHRACSQPALTPHKLVLPRPPTGQIRACAEIPPHGGPTTCAGCPAPAVEAPPP